MIYSDCVTTPEQSGRQLFGTPRREQHGAWFLPPAPHLTSLVNSELHKAAKVFSCDMLASYEQSGMHVLDKPTFSQQAVTL